MDSFIMFLLWLYTTILGVRVFGDNEKITVDEEYDVEFVVDGEVVNAVMRVKKRDL